MKALLIIGKYHAKQMYILILDGVIAHTVRPVAFNFCKTSFSRIGYVSTCFWNHCSMLLEKHLTKEETAKYRKANRELWSKRWTRKCVLQCARREIHLRGETVPFRTVKKLWWCDTSLSRYEVRTSRLGTDLLPSHFSTSMCVKWI